MYTNENRYCIGKKITDNRNVIRQHLLIQFLRYPSWVSLFFSKDADNTGISFDEEDDVLYPDNEVKK
jgi:hypothetical protein